MDRTVRTLRISRIILEFLTVNAVPTLLMAGSNMASRFAAFEKVLHEWQVAIARRANEAIIRDVPPGPLIGVQSGDPIAVILGADALPLCCALDFLTVFINACDEHDLFAFKSLKAGERIAGKGCVNAAEVRFGVDVVKRGCEAVGHRFGPVSQPQFLGLDLNDCPTSASHPVVL